MVYRPRKSILAIKVFVFVVLVSSTLTAAPRKVEIYRFPPGGRSGFGPHAGLVSGVSGRLYGTTEFGGTGPCLDLTRTITGCGVVFELTPPKCETDSWSERVILDFQDGPDGGLPLGGLLLDERGNLYGTTLRGGLYGGGTVFELSPSAEKSRWKETVLSSFPADFGVLSPSGNLTFDAVGNLYGTTGFLVTDADCFNVYEKFCGTAYQLAKPTRQGDPWTLTTLYEFKSGNSGPNGSLIFDSSGNLYGTTVSGGGEGIGQCADFGCGTAFELVPPSTAGGSWSEIQVHNFQEGTTGDGLAPLAGLVMNQAGNFFGTTQAGGTGGASDVVCVGPGSSTHCGTVFELIQSGGAWTETVIYDFQGGVDGSTPTGGLVTDERGNLYGTTFDGGIGNCGFTTVVYGCGTVFKLVPPAIVDAQGTKTTLFRFTGGNGEFPQATLMLAHGFLYGTTSSGGNKCPSGTGEAPATCGTVFRIRP